MKINVTLSKTELEKIVSKALFGERKQISITIEEGEIEESSRCLPTFVQGEDGLMQEDGWFLVPANYEFTRCPLNDLDQIEVQFRDGKTCISSPGMWGLSWVQENSKHDIVKFRPIKKHFQSTESKS